MPGLGNNRASTQTNFWFGFGFMSQSTNLQSCRDGATASSYMGNYGNRLAQGHYTLEVGIKNMTSRTGTHWLFH